MLVIEINTRSQSTIPTAAYDTFFVNALKKIKIRENGGAAFRQGLSLRRLANDRPSNVKWNRRRKEWVEKTKNAWGKAAE